MTFNYSTTKEILDLLKSYTENANISITTENTDWRGRPCKSDFMVIDEKNNVGFEVFDNEIIVFYFNDHCHFVDYIPVEDGQADYLERAKEFLLELFQYSIRQIEYYKRKKLIKDKYFMIYPDKEEFIGGTIYSFSFGKKQTVSKTWQFDVEKGCFTNRQLKKISKDAIEVIDINEDCYIEIFENKGVYTYSVLEIAYDDYYGMYYWIDAYDVEGSGLYIDKETAVKHALQAAKRKYGD